MKKEIAERIQKLGGTCNFTSQSLQGNIESVKLDKTYLQKEFEDYLDDDLYKKIEKDGDIPSADIKYPRISFTPKLFTPFQHGTADHKEWQFGEDEEAVAREVIDSETLNFMYVGNTDSYPNYYFICLGDKNPENPTVYTTDHETFFSEIEVYGTLEDFFNIFVTEDEYKCAMKGLAEELRNNK